MNNETKHFIKKISKGIIFLTIVAVIGLCLGVYAPRFFKKERKSNLTSLQKEKKFSLESLDILSVNQEQNAFTPNYVVIPQSEENLSIHDIQRFSQSIFLPLGLSQEELKENLTHAAWSLQKKKKAKGIIIFAYRMDDIAHNGGFTAGKCTLAPLGDWNKTINHNYSVSDLKPAFEFAEVYFMNKPFHNEATKTLIKSNQANLYYPDIEPKNIIAILKKNTEVLILKHKREFTTSDFLDIYQVRTTVNRKQITGFVLGNDLADAENKNETTSDLNKTNDNWSFKWVDETWIKRLTLLNEKISKWRKSPYEDKEAVCIYILLMMMKDNKLGIKMLDESSLKNYAMILVNTSDNILSNIEKKYDNDSTVFEFLIVIITSLGWIQ